MTIQTGELIQAVQMLADNQNIRVTIQGSAKGALITGASAFLGGLLLGPLGLAVGGTVGGVLSYAQSKDNFKSLATLINEMSQREKDKLANHILNGIRDIDIQDVMMIMTNSMIQKAVMDQVASYITGNTQYSIL